jgi:hypothetical protein
MGGFSTWLYYLFVKIFVYCIIIVQIANKVGCIHKKNCLILLLRISNWINWIIQFFIYLRAQYPKGQSQSKHEQRDKINTYEQTKTNEENFII